MPAQPIATLDELPEGGVLRRVLQGREIALFRVEGNVYAIDAQCPHRRGPLDEGDREEPHVVTCPWHGWRFDIRTGKSPTHPGQVRSYPVTLQGNSILIDV